jgi:hypothetical protein
MPDQDGPLTGVDLGKLREDGGLSVRRVAAAAKLPYGKVYGRLSDPREVPPEIAMAYLAAICEELDRQVEMKTKVRGRAQRLLNRLNESLKTPATAAV